jgi:hypothetical protein
VRLLVLVLSLCLSVPAAAQEQPVKKKKPTAAKKRDYLPKAHAKPTAEQIRRFNELEKKKR